MRKGARKRALPVRARQHAPCITNSCAAAQQPAGSSVAVRGLHAHGARAARAGALAQLLARLEPALGARGPGGAEAGALATMALEVATALTNPAIALDPGMPAPQRAREESPPCAEARAPPWPRPPVGGRGRGPRGLRARARRAALRLSYTGITGSG